MSNGGLTAANVIDLGEFGGPLGAPRGTAGGRGIIRLGGARPPGGRVPPGGRGAVRGRLAGRVRAALGKAPRPTKRGVAVGAGAVGAVSLGALTLGRAGPGIARPPTLKALVRAFKPRSVSVTQRAAFRGETPGQLAGRRIRETAAAVSVVQQKQGVGREEAGRILQRIARVKEARKRLRLG
jgi:hypothetical protein